MQTIRGIIYEKMKHRLKLYGYYETESGRIVLLFHGGYKYFLKDEEYATFSPEGLRNYTKKYQKQDFDAKYGR